MLATTSTWRGLPVKTACRAHAVLARQFSSQTKDGQGAVEGDAGAAEKEMNTLANAAKSKISIYLKPTCTFWDFF
jgi:hypothetical protein